MKNLKATKNYLRSVGRQTVANAKNVLRTKGITGSDLENSISYKLVKKGNSYILEFSMSEYGEFMDKGVSGNKKKQYYKDETGKRRKSPYSYKDKMPPAKVFEKWIAKKGIRGRSKKTGRFITRKSTAFAMAKYRQIHGYAGLSFFSTPLQNILTKFPQNLLNNIEKDFLKSIDPKTK